MRLHLPLVGLISVVATPVCAHPGEHGRMTVVELIQHYAAPDHLALMALTAIVGWLGYRYGRRVQARETVKSRDNRQGRAP